MSLDRVLQRLEFCFDNREPEKTEATRWLFENVIKRWTPFSSDDRLSYQWDVSGVGRVTVAFEVSSRIHVFIHKGSKHELWSCEVAESELDEMRSWLTANKLADMGENK